MYRVVISQSAMAALDEHVRYIAMEREAPQNAAKWLEKALRMVSTLKLFPQRCPLAPESASSNFEVRMLVVDTCVFTYRVDEANRVVRVRGFGTVASVQASRVLFYSGSSFGNVSSTTS